MKFTDKFVLVPYDQYKRLKNNLIVDEKNEKYFQQKGGAVEKTNSTEPNEVGRENLIKPVQARNELQRNNTPKNKTLRSNKKSFTPSKRNKNSTPRSYPLPPPGIPNKPKNIDFKWLTIFK